MLPSSIEAVFIVSSGSLPALDATLRACEENSMLPGLRLHCFASGLDSAQQAELERLAAGLANARRGITVALAGTDFVAALAEASRRFPDSDLVMLEPGVNLPFAWDARLAKAAHAAPRNAVALPLCDRGPMFSPVEAAVAPDPALDAGLIDRTVYCLGNRAFYEVPGLHSACAYFRRDALAAVLPSFPGGATPAALATRLRALGWSCVLCDYVYVGGGHAAPGAPMADEFEAQAFVHHHPFGVLRRALAEGIRHGLPPVSIPGLDERPVHLHVMHFWGGGLDRWVRDFARADAAATNLLFASYRIGEAGGQRLVLYADPDAHVPIRVWDIARPIRSTASESPEYRRILDQIIEEFAVEAIVVSSLIGHALDALTRPVRTIAVCHDYYPVCQAVNPQFGKTCERCRLDDLRACAASNPLNRIFQDQSSENWHAMRGLFTDHVLARGIDMVVPSPSVAKSLCDLDPRLAKASIRVIAHGTDFAAPKLAHPGRDAAQPLRIAVLGRMSLHKGTELLRAVAAELGPIAEVTLVGCGKAGMELAAQCGWKAIERFEPVELPKLLESLAPHAGLLPSVVPETFSYTLSELWTMGVPPIASNLGSFRDRIVEGETGFLFEPDAAGLLAVLRRLKGDPALLAGVARKLAAKPAERTTGDMVRDYRAVLPVASRPVARFKVGIGRDSALTEPYRHLEEAYAKLNAAYAQSSGAYKQVRDAYNTTRHELDDLQGMWNQWTAELVALRVTSRWWNVPKAIALVRDLPKRMQRLRGPKKEDLR